MEIQRAVGVGLQLGIPVIVWGEPGVGKTSFAYQLARQLDRHLEVVIAALREPSDFGFPIPVEDEGQMMIGLVPPAWAVRLKHGGILFLDEVSCAPPATQAALLRVVWEGCVGDLPLEDVQILLVANPADIAAGGWDLTPPMANRLLHLDWSVDAIEWSNGFLSGFPIPNIPLVRGWENHFPAAKGLISAFIRRNPLRLLEVPKDSVKAGRAWPSPRTWEFAAKVVAASKVAEIPQEVLLAGCVGQGPASEFLTWLENLDLPDPHEVLKDPSGFEIPKRGDLLFALLSSIVAVANESSEVDLWLSAWDVLARVATDGPADVAAVAAKSLIGGMQPGYPLPRQQIKPFTPLLQAAGLY
jgi:hypothetical protein